MLKKIMRRLGWVPLKDYAELLSDDADHVLSMQQWADRHEERSRKEYQKLAEALAETREALHDRKQLHHLQRLLLDREAMLPPRPLFLRDAHYAHLDRNAMTTSGEDDNNDGASGQ